MGLGLAEEEAPAEVAAEVTAELVPTEPAEVATAVVATGVVLLAYAGALDAAAEVVTGLTIVQGQLVTVKVVASVTVYVLSPIVREVASGQ